MRLETGLYSIAVLLLLAFLLAGTFFRARESQEFWLVAEDTPAAEAKVPPGTSYSELIAMPVVGSRTPGSFEPALFARMTGIDRQIKPGRYLIPGDWSPAQALEQFAIGANHPNRVTIPPGYHLEQVAMALEAGKAIRSATEWLDYARSANGVELVNGGRLGGSSVPGVEGLIAPETYFFEELMEPREALATLCDHWREFAMVTAGTSELSARMPNGLTLYETLILASVIEKESADPIEMATAASVFHNRLRKKWPLGSAATLRYAAKTWTGRDQDLPVNLQSPYNTSKKPGLPPTPICVVGKEAFLAALHPADTEYMFFVSDGEGGLTFNRTHEEHIRSVKDYREKTAAEAGP
jgi:UPF0755 protein